MNMCKQLSTLDDLSHGQAKEGDFALFGTSELDVDRSGVGQGNLPAAKG